MLHPHQMAGFHNNCSWIDVCIIGTIVIQDFLLYLVGPDLTCILKANHVKEITVALFQVV